MPRPRTNDVLYQARLSIAQKEALDELAISLDMTYRRSGKVYPSPKKLLAAIASKKLILFKKVVDEPE